ncbi:bifunctional 2-polyprenyl-6-hydroxyphenol methylase/3-demethylubiquinol 3-O-methyltransferase UbiG [Streptomyces sp. 7-21]|jgi:SAM-dependent methyltransferase|uniref:class I SAM-dependent methyltransferase n=1 Tax=Streptomyces sp. 7-21 TaxID=2802283 RepID=UPI00191F784A|nr:class I SAM-dependent methyltransferase [Streptomyces sp. 7-21]MBL1066454.1 methyltransferase domain-containing protein [Streptomyces sp. 7-21]
MPTIPPQPAPAPEEQPYKNRAVAESFGAEAERYERSRPHYPQALVERIAAACPGRRVLDVGCGTGIAARQFQAAGCEVLGVEPDARMAELARRAGVTVEVGKIEDWDPAGRVFDAVVAGQAWHWVDPVAGARQAARVLRPGGLLAPFWNVGQPPAPLADAFQEVYRRVVPDSLVARLAAPSATDAYERITSTVGDGIRQAGGFAEPEHWREDWQQTYSRDAWLDQLPTHGVLSQLTPGELAQVLAGVGAVIDAAGGSFTMDYTTVAVTAVREAGAAPRA